VRRFISIKKSRKKSKDIDEKIEYLNRELVKTGLQEMMTTSKVYQGSTKQPNQEYINLQGLSLNGYPIGLSAADGNHIGGAGLDSTGVALSPPHPVTGVRNSALHVRNGTGDTIPLRPNETTTRGDGNNPPTITMGSAGWFFDPVSDRWYNTEYFTAPGQDVGAMGFWDTNNAGFFFHNTTGSHSRGDILSVLSGINFGPNGVIGPPQTTVLTQNRLDDPGFLPINIPISIQAFFSLLSKAKDDAVRAITNSLQKFGMPFQIAQSVTENRPIVQPEPSESEQQEFFDNLNTIWLSSGDIPINDTKQLYSDKNFYIDPKTGRVTPHTEESRKQYPPNTVNQDSEGKSTIGNRGESSGQVYQNEKGEWVYSFEDHAYDNLNTDDSGETQFGAGIASRAVHMNVDRAYGRNQGGNGVDNTSPNTGEMSDYPCNSTACIRGDSIMRFEKKVDDIKNEEVRKAIYDAIERKKGKTTNESYITESVGLGHFDPEVLTVDINDIRKGIMPEFPKDPPPEMINGYSAKSKLVPKTIEGEPFIKITKKDLAKNHKLTDKEISEFMIDIEMINDYIKKNPAELKYAMIRYPKDDPRLAQLNYKMDQMKAASDEYMETHFPENQKLFNRLQQKISNTIGQTDPQNFKGHTPPPQFTDESKINEQRKRIVSKHFNKSVKIKKLFRG